MQLNQGTFDQQVQRVPDHLAGEREGLKAFLVQKVRAVAVAVQIGGRNQLEIRFLVLTNNSIYTARDLSARLRNSGIAGRVGERVDDDAQ